MCRKKENLIKQLNLLKNKHRKNNSNNGDLKKCKIRFENQSWDTAMKNLESEIAVVMAQNPEL